MGSRVAFPTRPSPRATRTSLKIKRLQAAAGGTAATEPDNSEASFKTAVRTNIEHILRALSRECWFFK